MHVIDSNNLETVGHEHDLIRSNAVGTIPPFNIFNRTEMRAMRNDSRFCDSVGFPSQQMPSADSPNAMICTADSLQHPVHRTWTLQLNNFTN